MNKQYFVLHLLPSRPDFAFTMTEDEKKIMNKHVEYWTTEMNKGNVIIFGPVLDPKGPYGLGIISVNDEADVEVFINNDPATKILKYEYYTMNALVPEKAF